MQRRGRAALCDTLEAVGPEAPTMCEGWRAIDLAAHLVVRERDAWTAPVILCGRLNGTIQRLQARERLSGFDSVVRRLREGPPWLFRSTPQTVRLNTVEDWIHREDVRRANDVAPEPIGPELDQVLWRGVGAAGKAAALRLGDLGLEAVANDGRRITVKRARRAVEVIGEAPEVLLFVTGRTEAAKVRLQGDPGAIEELRQARLHL